MSHIQRVVVLWCLWVVSSAAVAYAPFLRKLSEFDSVMAGQVSICQAANPSGTCAFGGWQPDASCLPYSCWTVTFNGVPYNKTNAPQELYCAVNATLLSGACYCNTKYVERGQSCVLENPTLLESLNGANQPLNYSGSPSLNTCFQGKVVRGSGAVCGGPVSPGKDNCTLMPPFAETGVSCTGSGNGGLGPDGLPVPNTEPPLGTPSNCAKGLVPGEVNGIGVCIKPTTGNTVQSTSTGGTSTSVNPDGSPGSTLNSPDNTTRSDTTCIGPTCTTKTESVQSTPGGGTTTAVNTTTETKDDYCTKNPRSPLCVDSSFGGGCGSFNGTGDALAVATAKAVSDTKCALETLKGVDGYGSVAISAAGTNPTDSPVNNKAVRSFASWSDASNPFSSSCLADYNVTMGKFGSIAVPFSAYCGSFQLMGSLLIGFALLFGSFIIVKGQ